MACAIALLLVRLAAFEWAVGVVAARLSSQGFVSPAGRAALSMVILGAAFVTALTGAFLLALGNPERRLRLDAAIRWDALRLRGLAVPSAYSMLACSAGLGLLIVLFWALHGRLGRPAAWLLAKEGPLEVATFVFELVGAALCAIAARRWKVEGERYPRAVPVLYALCALGLFLVGMEEINWGQTLLGFQTPSSWAAINYQQETSIHNLLDRDTLTIASKVIAVGFGVAVLGLIALSVRAPRSVFGAIAPHCSLLPLALMISMGATYLHPEVIELMLSVFFAFYSYRLYVASRSSSTARASRLRLSGAAVRGFVAATLVAVLLSRVDWAQVSQEIVRISAWSIVSVFSLMLLGLVVSAWKWSLSLRMHGLEHPFPHVLRVLMTGFFFNNFLPTAIGGDAYRIYRTLPREGYRSRALSAVAIERAMGFLMLFALGGLGALALMGRFETARIYALVLLAATLAGGLGFLALERGWLRGLALSWRRVRSLDAVRHNLKLLHNRRREWLPLGAASLIFQAISIGIIYVIFELLDTSVTPAQCALIAAAVGVAAVVPVSINGIGVMEGTFVAVATMFGIDYDHALVVAFIRRFVALALGVFCGVLYLIERRGHASGTGLDPSRLLASSRQGGLRGVWRMLRPSVDAPPAVASSDGAAEPRWWNTGLLEYTHDAIIIWEMDGGGILYWNRAAERLYGYGREEACGGITHKLLKTRLADGVDHLETTVARFGIWVGELEHTTRDGRQVVVDARLTLLAQHNGRWLVLEVNRDVTDQKAAEAGRAECERQLAELRALQGMRVGGAAQGE